MHLVSKEQLLQAFKLQAKTMKQEHNVDFKRLRTKQLVALWSRSKSDTTSTQDVLAHPPMSSGVHRWTLEVMVWYVWLGVATASKPVDYSKFLGDQKGVLIINGIGRAMARGTGRRNR